MADPVEVMRAALPRTLKEYYAQIRSSKQSPITYSRLRYKSRTNRLFRADPDSIIFQEVMNGCHQGSL